MLFFLPLEENVTKDGEDLQLHPKHQLHLEAPSGDLGWGLLLNVSPAENILYLGKKAPIPKIKYQIHTVQDKFQGFDSCHF